MSVEHLEEKLILTGVKPTGTLHLGNYVGAMKSILELSSRAQQNFVFIADYHALNSIKDSETMRNNSLNIAAAYVALGLDYRKAVFYRQSMVPEVFELNVILNNFTPKGFMNKAHAYKAMLEKNQQNQDTTDNGVNMGLYTYPILMAADILAFRADYVPVGKDQIQHIEITRDIATIFNSQYNTDILKLPEAYISEESAMIPGLDGRKMSKSYANIIPIFDTPENMHKYIMKIKTDSLGANEPKDPDNSVIMDLYRNFATSNEVAEMRTAFLEGKISYKQAKENLYTVIERTFQEPRIHYFDLINDRRSLENILQEGSEKARFLANITLREIRKIIGVR